MDHRLARPGRHRHPHPRRAARCWPPVHPTAGSRGRTGSTSAPTRRGDERPGPGRHRRRSRPPALRTPVPDLPAADLHLAQRRRPDVRRGAHRRGVAADAPRAAPATLPDPLSRALAVSTAWDMLVKGELAADDLLTCVLGRAGDRAQPGSGRAVPGAWPCGPPTSGRPLATSRASSPGWPRRAAALAEHPDHRAAGAAHPGRGRVRAGALRRCSRTPRPATPTSPGGCWSGEPRSGRRRSGGRRRSRNATRTRTPGSGRSE